MIRAQKNAFSMLQLTAAAATLEAVISTVNMKNTD